MDICIEIKNVKQGMTITRIVYNSKGKFIVGSNTVVTDSVLNKLRLNNIRDVYIGEEEKRDRNAKMSADNKVEPPKEVVAEQAVEHDEFYMPIPMIEGDQLFELPPEKLQEFKSFEWDYNIKQVVVRDALASALKGKTDLKKINAISSDLINSLRVKSDLLTYLNRIKLKDTQTFSHSLNVSLLSNLFGSWLHLSEGDLELITEAGMLHDVGKTQIDDAILTKPGKLTDEEFTIMKSHALCGYRILEPQNIDTEIKLAALMHHEKLDGSGYPMGVAPEKITEVTRIISICDIYEAMVADRVYRPRIIPFRVIDRFTQGFFGKLDMSLTMVFLENIAQTYCNSTVELSDGRIGEIVFINKMFPAKPVVRIKDEFVDLSKKDLEIIKLF